MKVQDLFIESLGLIGAIAIDELPTNSEFTACMRTCNMMLDSWSAESLMVRSTTRETFPLVSGQYIYTIGIGKNFNTSKPIKLEDAFFRDDANYDTPVTIITKDLYDNYPDKIISSGRPEVIMYDPGASQQSAQYGNIYVYPIPDASQSYNLTLESSKYLTEFVNLTDDVTFEPAYFEAIAWNLAERLWPKFNRIKPIPPTVVMGAMKSKRVIQNMNATIPTANMDLPGMKGGTYNIYTDQ